jgi:hypothetical protein
MKAKYYLYRNLRTGGFSIKYKGIVVARDNLFTMRKVTFHVNENGRKKVIKEKQKNVHAFIVAKKFDRPAMVSESVYDIIKLREYKEVSYNPYGADHFFLVETNEPIYNACHVICIDGKVYIK